MMAVLHRYIWKPTRDGNGLITTTLCGRVDNSGDDANVADTDSEVTCKLCLPLLNGTRKNHNSKWIRYEPND